MNIHSPTIIPHARIDAAAPEDTFGTYHSVWRLTQPQQRFCALRMRVLCRANPARAWARLVAAISLEA